MRTPTLAIVAAALIAATGVTTATTAQAETVLRFNSFLPPTHLIRKDGWAVWASQVAKVTGGRVRVVFTTKPLGSLPRSYDMVRDGVADIGWGVQGYTPGRFISAEIAEMPFLSDKAEALSVAYWRVYKRYFEKAGEYKDVHLLTLHSHGPGDIMTGRKKLFRMADLRGLKVRIVNPVTARILRMYSGAPVREPAPKLSQLMSKGVIDGSFNTAAGVRGFRLGKYFKHWLRIPGGIYNTSFFMAVNKAKWANISAADRKAIMGVSGEAFAAHMGRQSDLAQTAGTKLMAGNGTRITDVKGAALAALKKKLAPFEQRWIAKVKARGIDGAGALRMLRAEIAAYKAK